MGTGRFSKTIVGRSANFIGIDSSISMLKITRKKCSNVSTNSPVLIRADATKLPFKNNVFDYVVCINALNHMPKYYDAVGESSRVLKSRGVFVFNFPNLASVLLPLALIVNIRAKSVLRPVFSKWYDPKSFFGILSKNKLTVEAIAGHIPVSFAQHSIDQIVRKSPFKRISGVLFVKAKKI